MYETINPWLANRYQVIVNRQTGGGVGSNSNSGSIDIPAIEITKDSDFVCDNDDYVETPSSGRRSIQQQHQQVSPIVTNKKNPQQTQ